jgi:hypothetical protein
MCRPTDAMILKMDQPAALIRVLPQVTCRKALVLKHFSQLHEVLPVYGGIAAELGPREARC